MSNSHVTSRVPVSFEVYPPRGADGMTSLQRTIRHLATVGPRFISVTFGAGGSHGGDSLEVLRFIRDHTDVDPLAHLTCVGNTYAGAAALIAEFLDAGIESFLALRGDPPKGGSGSGLGDLESAAQLVQLIRGVHAERAPYDERRLPGLAAVSVEPRRAVRIAVAAFPNGRPGARSVSGEIDTLLAKQAAGATLAITQLFFHADQYLTFIERARRSGVTIPILPGIMPITSPERLRRVLELTGEELPADLGIALDIEPTVEGRADVGISHAAALVSEIVAGGAPGIHLYAFNQHETVLHVLSRSGVVSAPVCATRPPLPH